MPPIVELLWSQFFFNPMLNILLGLYAVLFHNFGLTILVFTILVRLAILPLTLRQLHSAKSMSSLQPKMQELQRRYGQDRERLSKETWALYREHGVNPAGCALPMLIQMPIWIGLYQAILFTLGDRPESLLALADHMYPLQFLDRLVPVNSSFLWLNLAHPDPTYIIAVLVGVSAFVQQKMTTMPSNDPSQAQMNRMMTWMMPLMYGYFTVVVSSGLALYWLISNIVGIAIQYFVTGWGTLIPNQPGARGIRPLIEFVGSLRSGGGLLGGGGLFGGFFGGGGRPAPRGPRRPPQVGPGSDVDPAPQRPASEAPATKKSRNRKNARGKGKSGSKEQPAAQRRDGARPSAKSRVRGQSDAEL
jgi:YidC/Oxa1 family membrane protein insertase